MRTTSIIAMNNLDAHRAMVIANRTNDAFATGMLTASSKSLKAELAKRNQNKLNQHYRKVLLLGALAAKTTPQHLLIPVTFTP